MWAIHSTYNIVYVDDYSVSTSRVVKKRRRVASSTARTTDVEIRIRLIFDGGYEWGEHIYTEREFQDIFILGLEVKSLKKKWQRKRNDVRKVMIKCERDLDNFTRLSYLLNCFNPSLNPRPNGRQQIPPDWLSKKLKKIREKKHVWRGKWRGTMTKKWNLR